MANYLIVFDIGSQYVSATLVDDGFCDRIPSVVALGADGKQIVAVGNGVEKAVQSGAKISHPILDGTIIDVDGAKALFDNLLERVLPAKQNVFNRFVAKCIVPCGTISSDKRTIETIFLSLGAREVSFIETPIVDSLELFCRYQINAGIVVDIGCDCTDIAAVEDGKIINGCTLFHSGKQLTEALRDKILSKYLVQLSFAKAEELKKDCASLYSNDLTVRNLVGQNVRNNTVESINVSSKELYDTVVDFCKKYVMVIQSIVSTLPQGSKVLTQGILLCGGGANLAGLDLFLHSETGLKVRKAEHCEEISMLGAMQLIK